MNGRAGRRLWLADDGVRFRGREELQRLVDDSEGVEQQLRDLTVSRGDREEAMAVILLVEFDILETKSLS